MTGPVIARRDRRRSHPARPGPLVRRRARRSRWWPPWYIPAPAALGSGRVDAEWVADRRHAAEQVLDEARKALDRRRRRVDLPPGRVVVGRARPARPGREDRRRARSWSVPAAAPPSGCFAGSSAAGRSRQRRPAVAPAGRGAPGAGRIGVAYVDTPDGRAALAEAAALARRTGLPLRLYTVVAGGDATRLSGRAGTPSGPSWTPPGRRTSGRCTPRWPRCRTCSPTGGSKAETC